MYKLIIVDDEKNIRDGLNAYFQSYDGGFSVAATFDNAAKALEYLSENDCDAVLTDIRMDTVSGLDLARTISERKYPIKVVLISGYREFEYAQKALRYNVFDYLLKPVRFDVLDKLCENLKRQLDEEHQNDVSGKQNVMEEFLKNQLIMEMDAGLYANSAALYERMENRGLSKAWTENPCVRIRLEIPNDEKNTQNKLKECIKTVCTKTFEGKEIKCSIVYGANRTVNFFVYCSKENYAEDAECFFDSVKNLLNMSLNSIEEMFGVAVKINEFKCFFSVSEYAAFASQINEEEQILKIEQLITAAIAEKDKKTMESLMTILVMYASKSGNVHGFGEVKDFLRLLKNSKREKDNEKDFDEENIEEKLTDIVKNALDNPVEEMHGNIMTRALEYIDENYNRELSISEVADKVYFNPVYFGKLFKLYMGESFTDYLIAKRLLRAKELLGRGVKIQEAANAVGYENTKYFIRLFKKREGITPGAYQKMSR